MYKYTRWNFHFENNCLLNSGILQFTSVVLRSCGFLYFLGTFDVFAKVDVLSFTPSEFSIYMTSTGWLRRAYPKFSWAYFTSLEQSILIKAWFCIWYIWKYLPCRLSSHLDHLMFWGENPVHIVVITDQFYSDLWYFLVWNAYYIINERQNMLIGQDRLSCFFFKLYFDAEIDYGVSYIFICLRRVYMTYTSLLMHTQAWTRTHDLAIYFFPT